MSKFEVMTEQPVKKLIVKLSVPTIISMLVTTFYNMADTYFVSKMKSTSATGAVGVVFSLMAFIQAFGFFFGHGSGNFISRALGAEKKDEAKKMAATGFYAAMFCGIVIMIAGLCFRRPLVYLLGATDSIYPYALDYMSVVLVGAPFVCGSFVLNNQLRFQGNASFAMLGITSGAILNCVLDPILITGFGLGITGAAIATVVGQIVSFVLLLVGSYRSDNIKINFKNIRFTRYYMLNILNGGAPSLARQGIAAFSTACLNFAGGGFGDYAITAMSICSRVIMFLNSAMIGFGQGFQPVCGFNYGAGKYDRVREAFWFCVKTSVVFLVVLSAAGFIFSAQIISIFSEDAQVIRFGTNALRFMCISFPANAWIVMANMCMQTMGKSLRASFLAAARQGIVLIPLLLTLPRLFGEGGLEITQMVADLITLAIAVPLQITILRELHQNGNAD